MKNLVRCKVCGYVMEEGKLKDTCPACGVPAKAFEPYKTKLSEKRYKILSLHIHPIILHLPQGCVVLALMLLALALVTGGALHDYLVTIAKFNLGVLPLFALAGMASGIYDGKVRFKKLSPSVLKFKIILGAVFVALTCVAAALILLLQPVFWVLLLVFVVTLAAMGCAAVLGKVGSSLFEASMPG